MNKINLAAIFIIIPCKRFDSSQLAYRRGVCVAESRTVKQGESPVIQKCVCVRTQSSVQYIVTRTKAGLAERTGSGSLNLPA